MIIWLKLSQYNFGDALQNINMYKTCGAKDSRKI